MSNIASAFANGKAFIPFITCGDPDLATTEECVVRMEKAGASLIELGIPFSDPTAEGPVIQAKNGDTYEQADKHLKGSSAAVSVALRAMHHEMANFADEAINRFSASERNFTGLTMGISEDDYKLILQELDTCRKRVAQIALNSRGTERVYRLNLQLFPLTWKGDKCDGKETR